MKTSQKLPKVHFAKILHALNFKLYAFVGYDVYSKANTKKEIFLSINICHHKAQNRNDGDSSRMTNSIIASRIEAMAVLCYYFIFVCVYFMFVVSFGSSGNFNEIH